MTLSVYSLQRVLFEGRVISATFPTALGEMTVLDHHLPLVARLTPGDVRYLGHDNQHGAIAIAGGIVEIRPESEVVVLAGVE
ncbi:MAG: hypothetical protein HY006_02095 [Candidatus Sungbacteria bacterium]|nr:hypothetical protein [Candidatus Sungbacteria bacterium]